ncbi:sensor histidine kinase [Paractinoplanes globisporus]|uniref:histidine kinase n=1 Tax=Paractinoplanes globisporus TaxID=113565 RepID=A0ABW6WFL8_9ACTN|nr:HAMP domain-containing sensor histidine kinase [Actinoplanes globisporus]
MRPRLTVRARLTLLYTGLFLACGVALVAITYGLVAGMPYPTSGNTDPKPGSAEELKTMCHDYLTSPDEKLRTKCTMAYQEGLLAGAKDQRAATLDTLLRYSLLTLGGVTVFAAVAGWFVAGRVLRPVQQITAAARAASEHNLNARVALTGPRDELRELADTFDTMLARLQAAFDSQGRFIADAGHELRTPLTVMRTAVEVVLAKPEPTREELCEMGRDVQAAVAQTERLIAALLTLARNESGLTVREPVDLATVAEDAMDAAATNGVRRHALLDPAGTVGDPVLLERLIVNLVENAARYNVPDGELWVVTGADSRTARVTVANRGPVIPAEQIATLFEPFHRLGGRTADGGLGLGLTIVASIADMHAGTVVAHPRPDGGLTVTVSLPVR